MKRAGLGAAIIDNLTIPFQTPLDEYARSVMLSIARAILIFLSLMPVIALGDSGPSPAYTGVHVLTQHNDNFRTGANLSETILNTSNVSVRKFGKLYAVPVDGNIYAQILYVSKVPFSGELIDVFYAVTEHNSVYAINADNGKILWVRNLGPSMPRDDINDYAKTVLPDGRNFEYWDMYPETGITATPVISLETQKIYITAKVKHGTGDDAKYAYELHCLDLVTGSEESDSPVTITATVNSAGKFDPSGPVRFDAFLALNRAGLLLVDGRIYITFASHGDIQERGKRTYHGWIFSYDIHNLLAGPEVVCVTPGGVEGGIWQSGAGLACDQNGAIYALTGNGTSDATNNLGDSVLRLERHPSLEVADFFTPYNHAALLEAIDLDLGSGGPLFLRGEHAGEDLLIGGGKEGRLYLLDPRHLGGAPIDSAAEQTAILQSFQVSPYPTDPHPSQPNEFCHIHGTPIAWRHSFGYSIYLWPEMDYLKEYRVVHGRVPANHGDVFPVSRSEMPAGNGMPGGALSISAKGSDEHTGILWASLPFKDDANRRNVPGVLIAFDASDISKIPLWRSSDYPARDDSGYFAKFCPPTIANGRVFLPSFVPENADRTQIHGAVAVINVYGLLPETDGHHSHNAKKKLYQSF